MNWDIAIVGGGFAGSAASILLARQGYRIALFDPDKAASREFRCEKFNTEQIETLERMALGQFIFPHVTPLKDVWIARYGRLVNQFDYPNYGFSYEEIVTALRKAALEHFSGQITFFPFKARQIEPFAGGQRVRADDDIDVKAKLVILANGLNPGLQQQLDLERKLISKQHCLAVGFDLTPQTGHHFSFDSLTYWSERPALKMAYCAYFRYSRGYRANMFGYWDKHDPDIKLLRKDPAKALSRFMPNNTNIMGSTTPDNTVQIRPIDLYQIKDPARNGTVLIGDAFSTSCPGAGTGTGKALIDVEQLCNIHIPNWFSIGDFSTARMAEFYADPVKVASDQHSLDEAFHLRALTLDTSPKARFGRMARFGYHFGRGLLNGTPFRGQAQTPVAPLEEHAGLTIA